MEPGMSLAEIEKEAIKKTLRYHHNDKNKAAMSLQIGLATLYRKMKEYGLEGN
jgi:transcriptional regulator with PAS, ATPase and Fis domain